MSDVELSLEFNRVIGERVRAARRSVSTSMQVLAGQAGMTPMQLQRCETGAAKLPACNLVLICRFVNCPIDEILGDFEVDE